MQFINKLKNIIKQAVSGVTDDTGEIPTTIVDYLGKKSKAIRLSPYGLCTNPPEVSDAVLLSINAHESQKYALIDHFQNRFKNLKHGEVVLTNYMSGSYIYLKENGDIKIRSEKDQIIEVIGNCDITVNGNITAHASGNITATTNGSISAAAGTYATIQAPAINLTGNVLINGTLGVTGGSKATFSGDIEVTNDITVSEATINGIAFTTHVHGGVVAGGADTEVAK